MDGASVALGWAEGEDAETASQCLTYNIRVGSARGMAELYSAMGSGDGYRMLMRPGSVNMNTTWTIHGLGDGTYYWSVQTIDGSLTGSSFAPEMSFDIGSVTTRVPDPLSAEEGHLILQQNHPNPVAGRTVIRYAIAGGNPASAAVLSLYDMTGTLVRVLDERPSLPGNYAITVDLGDLQPGLYFYTLNSGPSQSAKKLIRK